MEKDINYANSPWDFPIDIRIGNFHMEYFNLAEVCQGGPIIGNIKVNNKPLFPHIFFGGPIIAKQDTDILIPCFNMQHRMFELWQISLSTHDMKILTPPRDVIWLYELTNDTIYFYDDMRKENYSYVNIKTGEILISKQSSPKKKWNLFFYLLFPFMFILSIIMYIAGGLFMLSVLFAKGIGFILRMGNRAIHGK